MHSILNCKTEALHTEAKSKEYHAILEKKIIRVFNILL